MNAKRNYSGLDVFRLLAAFLVVAIHTSPLQTLNPDANFFLVNILARLAVPFFFMVTGQFILSDFLFEYEKNAEAGNRSEQRCNHRCENANKLWKYLKKVAFTYMTAILIYLPAGLLTGRYEGITFCSALRMLVFDGTFYHLWYFPACIMGILIVYLLDRFLPFSIVFAVTGILYCLGLFGDSYYNLMMRIPFLSSAYEIGFHFFSYTRSGLFLAPFFLAAGAVIGRQNPQTIRRTASGIGFILSLLLLSIEAFALKDFHPKHHDNMYLFLVPCICFLYQLLLSWNVPLKSAPYFRTLSTWIYILHPAIILLIHESAPFSTIMRFLSEHYFIRYGTVCVFSVILSCGILMMGNLIRRNKTPCQNK